MLGIPIVNESWLYRSNEKGYFIDIKDIVDNDEYHLKYFSGIVFGLIGFDEKENNFIDSLIKG
jgi:hypothetical protein